MSSKPFVKIKTCKMSKNIIIGLLAIVSGSSLTYAYVQKKRADEQEALAMEQMKIATEERLRAEHAQNEAEMQRRMAERARIEAEHQAMMALDLAQRAREQVKQAHKALGNADGKK